MLLARKVSSTSSSGENLVDGLPPSSSMETVAKRAEVGPRTQIISAMKMLFLEILRFESELES